MRLILLKNSYIHICRYIKAVKSFFERKIDAEGGLRPRQTISWMLKNFAAKVYTTFFSFLRLSELSIFTFIIYLFP
jgi:hypothetical protein